MKDKFEEVRLIKKLKAKRRRGEPLSESELRYLEGEEALEDYRRDGINKGAYVKVKCSKGVIEGTLVGKDDDGNLLVGYAPGLEALITPEALPQMFLIRESRERGLKHYVMGSGLYERIVNKDGLIEKFFDPRLERKRAEGEFVELPDDERLAPGDDWGMKVK